MHQLRRLRRIDLFRRGNARLSARQCLPVARLSSGARGHGQLGTQRGRGRRLAWRSVRHGPGRSRGRRRTGRPARQLHRRLATAPARGRERVRMDADQRRIPGQHVGAVAEPVHPLPRSHHRADPARPRRRPSSVGAPSPRPPPPPAGRRGHRRHHRAGRRGPPPPPPGRPPRPPPPPPRGHRRHHRAGAPVATAGPIDGTTGTTAAQPAGVTATAATTGPADPGRRPADPAAATRPRGLLSLL